MDLSIIQKLLSEGGCFDTPPTFTKKVLSCFKNINNPSCQ